MSKSFLFQAIQFSQTVLIKTIQFNISMQLSSIQPIDSALSGATTPAQSWPASNGNEGLLHIPQSPSFTHTSLLDCLAPYSVHSSAGVLPFCRGAVSVFCSPNRLDNHSKAMINQFISQTDPNRVIVDIANMSFYKNQA